MIHLLLTSLGGLLLCCNSWCATWPMPRAHDDLIGQVEYIHPREGETLFDIGRRFDMGYHEMIEANPQLPPGIPLSKEAWVTVPSRYILPTSNRRGIVVNLAELRLYYFYLDGTAVMTLPVGIGKENWETPRGKTKVVAKQRDPHWFPTKRIRDDAARIGEPLPKVVPPGPNNPLGRYTLRLGWPTYLIHGTSLIQGVGRRSTAGCMRLFPEDMEALFHLVDINTPVEVVNLPYKIGCSDDTIYLESHVPLQEDLAQLPALRLPMMEEALELSIRSRAALNWGSVKRAMDESYGIPVNVSDIQRYSD